MGAPVRPHRPHMPKSASACASGMVAKKRFQVIHHKFPEPGHSYLDSDRDFAHVEKAVKQRQNIYCVDDYHCSIIIIIIIITTLFQS